MPKPLTPAQITDYNQLFDSCIITASKYPEIDKQIQKITDSKSRYFALEVKLGIPWFCIGLIHSMECNCDFSKHLHNGDPLNTRTVQVPAGRPLGNPPFTWEESAIDALKYQGYTTWKDWSIPGFLYLMELYNGLGYRKQGINSPYLWSFSNLYKKGKYVADGKYDPNAISKQCGVGVLLRRMVEKQIISIDTITRIAQIKQIGETVLYNTGNTKVANAEKLQTLLNATGIPIRIDGKAGQNTSNAYFQITGKYLNGDPRR